MGVERQQVAWLNNDKSPQNTAGATIEILAQHERGNPRVVTLSCHASFVDNGHSYERISILKPM